MRSAFVTATATGVAYALVGWIALGLAIPPTYAAPLYPSAGIALAAAMVFGPAAVPGAFLGSFAVNAYTTWLRGPLGVEALLLPALTGLGAALQAEAGRRLVARLCGAPAALSEPGEVARFYALAVPLSCLTSASVATAAFVAAGTVPASGAPFLWWTWWAGDTLGVLIGAPIVLALIGRPRADWAPRRVSLGLPLLVITLLLALAILQVARWDEQRAASRFERDARSAAAAVASRLQQPLAALRALEGLDTVAPDIDDATLRAAMARWLDAEPALRAAGRSVWVAPGDVPALEARRRAAGAADFRVFDRPGAAPRAADEPLMVIVQIEPAATNRAALGVNQRSIPAAREAIDASRRTGLPVASAGFRLTQETGDRTGVVVYQALYDAPPGTEPATEDERLARTRGLVFITVEPDLLLASAGEREPTYLRRCLLDTDPQAERPLLAGDAGCLEPARAGAHVLSEPVTFAARLWTIRVDAARDAVPDEQRGSAFLFSLVALAAAALLGALLMAVTGRTRRIEVAVDARTAELQREVAERRRAEAALREREQQLRAIVDTAPLGICYTELDGRILAPNPAFCALLGRPAGDLVGRAVEVFMHPDDVPEGRQRLAALREGRIDAYRRRSRFVRPDGSEAEVQISIALLRDDDGRPHRIVGVVEDIGEHLRLAQAERDRDAAEAANRAKSEFVSRMSHELRTPLNAMLGFAQLLELDRAPALAPHQSGWTAQIQRAGWHLLQMINDTLDLSRIESGTLRLHVEALDLRELLPACTALVEPAARARRLRVATAVEPEAATVLGDLTRVKQVLVNLLSNAVKYNVDGGTVDVRARAAGEDRVAIDVADTGLGMTAEQVAHLFEPFNRLGRETSGQEGTGIGLVIARRLAEAMGGTLQAASRPGEGSCFTLTLPRGDAAAHPPAESAADEPPALRYRRRLVHYVEDNATNAEVMRGILAQRPQIRLEVSALGRDGLAAIRERRPHVVLLDMHLPDLDGLEVLRRLKADTETEDIPVIAVSADATRDTVTEALREGALHYLTKPVDVGELLAVLDDLLERQDTRFG